MFAEEIEPGMMNRQRWNSSENRTDRRIVAVEKKNTAQDRFIIDESEHL
jgi:hypothetical protein